MKDGTEVDPREERLPKWAQNQMQVLRMRLDEARRQIEEFGDPGSPIRLVGVSGGDLRVPNRPVMFEVGMAESDRMSYDAQQAAPGETDVMVRLRNPGQMHQPYGHDVLEVMASNGRLDVEPQAANAIRIRVRW